ncbi:TetR family transcriptional regulator [Streptomyces sp. NPDC055794]
MAQKRAIRTRDALTQAAAEHFDRYGYAGTTLVRVAQDAGSSMGALTFHFPTKERLADVLVRQGTAVTRGAVDDALGATSSALARARAVLLTVSRLLDSEPRVRAAARLAREHHDGAEDWSTSWFPRLQEQLVQAHAAGELRSEEDVELLSLLAVYHIVGDVGEVRRHLRRRSPAVEEGQPASSDERLGRLWDLIVCGPTRRPSPARCAPRTQALS